MDRNPTWSKAQLGDIYMVAAKKTLAFAFSIVSALGITLIVGTISRFNEDY
jgi:hypothetical protein